MDSELTRLRRDYADDPSDLEAAQRYERGLRRAGLREEVDELYRLTFKCPLKWEELKGDPYDEVRACERCERDVYYVRNRREMARWVAQGECVALDPEALEESIRVLADVSLTDPAQAPGRPCVLEVEPGSGPQALNVRGMISVRLQPPPAEQDERDVDELLAEVDEIAREAREDGAS